MQPARKRIADGFVELSGGMDSGRNASILERNKVAYARNVRFREGFPRNRPGFKKLPLLFRKIDPNNSLYEVEDTDLRAVFEDGTVQGAEFYSNLTIPGIIVAVVGGRFFQIELSISQSSKSDGTYQSGYRVKEMPLLKTQTTNVLAGTTINIGISANVTVGSAANILVSKNGSIDIGGVSFRLNSVTQPQTINITNLTSSNQTIASNAIVTYYIVDANSDAEQRAYFCKAEQFLIIQDGQSRALIFDGARLRRSLEHDFAGRREVPTGTVMAYGNGRLWVAIQGKYFIAGDIVGGPTGTDSYGFNDSLLKFTENDYLNEGGYFRVPDQAGNITAMKFVSTVDTALGQGPLQIFTETHVFSVNAPIDRDEWKNLQYPIQTVSLVSNGAAGDKSTILVNGDIFYRAKDGIRSFVLARREIGEWGNTPLSNEVGTILNHDAKSLLTFSSAALFDNRLLMTSDPAPNGSGCYHRSLIALDFHGISAMAIRTPPAYDGVWDLSDSDIYFTQLVSGSYNRDDRCFFIGLLRKSISLAADFTVPAIAATVTLTVSSTTGMESGGSILIRGKRWRITTIGGSTSVTVTNESETAGIRIQSGQPILVQTNQLWEISQNDRFDYNGDETQISISSYIDTPSYPFTFGLSAQPSDAFQLKRLEMGELFVDDIFGDVDFVVKYRPDQSPEWFSWHTWSESVTAQNCNNCSGSTNSSLTCLNPGYRARMRLPTPSDTCETGQTKLSRYGYEFQGQLQWTGSARIKKFRMQAEEQQETAAGECRS